MYSRQKKEIYNDQRFLQLNLEDENILKELSRIKLTMPSTECLTKVVSVTNKFERLHQN